MDFIVDDVEALDLLPVWLKRFLSPGRVSNSSSSRSTNGGAQLDLLLARAFPEIFTVVNTEQELHDIELIFQEKLYLLLSSTEIVGLFWSVVVLKVLGSSRKEQKFCLKEYNHFEARILFFL